MNSFIYMVLLRLITSIKVIASYTVPTSLPAIVRRLMKIHCVLCTSIDFTLKICQSLRHRVWNFEEIVITAWMENLLFLHLVKIWRGLSRRFFRGRHRKFPPEVHCHPTIGRQGTSRVCSVKVTVLSVTRFTRWTKLCSLTLSVIKGK